jgi:ornithine cyclodeaminase/alanine dehydrogenase-like protein (mu-crystallin family)
MANKNILFLSKHDIKKVITMKETITLMSEAFAQISDGVMITPLRTHIDISGHNAGALFMPAYSEKSDVISLKLVTVFNNNPEIDLPLIHALVVLIDGTKGEPLAVMDGEYLTALRTGAGSGLATKLLARENATTLGIFGAGVQGQTQMDAICEVRDIQRVIIFDKNSDAAHSLAKIAQDKHHIATEIDMDGSQISSCDIICTATTSSTPLFSDINLKNGVHINAIGAYQADKREVPGETIKRSKLVVDQVSACLGEAGDVIIPMNDGLINKDHIFAELGEIVTDQKSGRTDPSEITIFKSVGNAAQDLVTAAEIYKKAQEFGIGTPVEL